MKHLAAYLLLGIGGNESPSAKDIKGVLESVGIDADDDRLQLLLKELEGKSLQEVAHCGHVLRDTVELILCKAYQRRLEEARVGPVWRRWRRWWWCCRVGWPCSQQWSCRSRGEAGREGRGKGGV